MDISRLQPGDAHYMAYIGPPAQYDIMGAAQFRLLCALGLRANHRLLDFGCGSLRAGRLFLAYLDRGCYFAVEPNTWLIEEAVKNQLGQDMIALKNPHFNDNTEFKTNVFGGQQFDFILAQSVFSHAGGGLISTALANFRESLDTGGLIAATFIEADADFAGEGWVYPDCVGYTTAGIQGFIDGAGLFGRRIPWYHPRQSWYLLAKSRKRLPAGEMLDHLSGAILFEEEFRASWQQKPQESKQQHSYTRLIRRLLPGPVKKAVKRLFSAG